jgi:hypothetical protein
VVGEPRVLGDSLSINAVAVRRIPDLNELTHHLMAVLFCHLRNTRPLPPSADRQLPTQSQGSSTAPVADELWG